MIKLILPQLLARYTNGSSSLSIEVSSLKELMDFLKINYPQLIEKILYEDRICGYANVYHNSKPIDGQIGDLWLENGDNLEILLAVAGG